MYVRYKKNIQENDLPRKRVRKASKIAGSGRQDLEIRCPERGRKHFSSISFNYFISLFGNKMPREGTETLFLTFFFPPEFPHLEIRCPERGRKHDTIRYMFTTLKFGNKMPREGTETFWLYPDSITLMLYLEIRCPERGRKPL